MHYGPSLFVPANWHSESVPDEDGYFPVNSSEGPDDVCGQTLYNLDPAKSYALHLETQFDPQYEGHVTDMVSNAEYDNSSGVYVGEPFAGTNQFGVSLRAYGPILGKVRPQLREVLTA